MPSRPARRHVQNRLKARRKMRSTVQCALPSALSIPLRDHCIRDRPRFGLFGSPCSVTVPRVLLCGRRLLHHGFNEYSGMPPRKEAGESPLRCHMNGLQLVRLTPCVPSSREPSMPPPLAADAKCFVAQRVMRLIGKIGALVMASSSANAVMAIIATRPLRISASRKAGESMPSGSTPSIPGR